MGASISMLTALVKMKCPRCRQGNIFKNQNPYNLKQVGDMFDLCPVCNLNFRPEPGFYFGGAMISYPMMILINMIVFLGYYFITGNVFDHPLFLMSVLAFATLLAAPVVFRYSRIIFLYILVGFRKS